MFIFGLVPEFLMRFLAWLLIHTFYRVDKEGLENIPEAGPCVVICNHVSYVDAVVIAGCVRRPIRFVMDHRIFRVPVLSFIFRTMRTIPIASAREDAALKEHAFADVAKALAEGEIVGIFPEGQLTSTGEMGEFRPGLERITRETPCAGCAAGAFRPLGLVLQPLARGQGDAATARGLFAHCTPRGARGATGTGFASGTARNGAGVARRAQVTQSRDLGRNPWRR